MEPMINQHNTPTTLPLLPPELLQLIVEAVLPTNERALIPTSHPSTKTLLSLTRVSRVTYKLAAKLLRQRCLYIDTNRRLADVLLCMYRSVPTMPSVLSLRNITSLYLSPFQKSLDDQPTAMWVRELFFETADSLRRLIVEMPFRSLDRLDDHLNVRRILRDGFESLCKVEEFVCIGDYPTLSVLEAHTDVWRLWPDLKRLVLFGVPANNHWLWWDIATLPKLEHVILARAEHYMSLNVKDEYFHKLPREDPRLDREIRITFMDVACDMGDLHTERWDEIDPKGRMSVDVFEVPISYYGDETLDEVVAQWARREALNGKIWELEGESIGPSTKKRLPVT